MQFLVQGNPITPALGKTGSRRGGNRQRDDKRLHVVPPILQMLLFALRVNGESHAAWKSQSETTADGMVDPLRGTTLSGVAQVVKIVLA